MYCLHSNITVMADIDKNTVINLGGGGGGLRQTECTPDGMSRKQNDLSSPNFHPIYFTTQPKRPKLTPSIGVQTKKPNM